MNLGKKPDAEINGQCVSWSELFDKLILKTVRLSLGALWPIYRLAFIEVVSKPHLRPNGCVAVLRQMLTYPRMLRFLDRPAPCP